MPKPSLFLDSSALFAGVVSATGALRALLVLGETSLVPLTISEQVVAETERAMARKAPRALPSYRDALRRSGLSIVRDPSPSDVAAHAGIVRHQPDVPIVVAAIQARVDYLVALNRRHFIDDPDVAARSGVLIGTPGKPLPGCADGSHYPREPADGATCCRPSRLTTAAGTSSPRPGSASRRAEARAPVAHT